MRQRTRGFTLVEMLVVILVLVLLVLLGLGLFIRPRSAANEHTRRSACANNLFNMIKACHLYSDATPNLGSFPLYNESHSTDGHKAMAKLYDAYVKDHRVYSCPESWTTTNVLKRYIAPDESALQTGYTNYGYDPGHKPAHATVGVIADFSDDPTKNSRNHGSDRPGQNVARGAGSVEWLEGPDGIYSDEGYDESLETFIIQ